MNKKKILFIINPISGVGKQKIVEIQAEKILDKSICDFEFAYTNGPKHATELAYHATRQFDIVVAVGGDGTINEVASGILNSSTILAVVPTGSGNGLARCLDIPLNISRALKVINTGSVRKIDTVTINEHMFVNLAGIGFDAEVGYLFANYGKRGGLSYVKIVANELRKYKPQHYTLEWDGKRASFDAFLISFANSTQYGNNALIAPKALVDDGLLDVCVLKKFPLVLSPILAVQLFSGTINDSPYIHSFQTKQLTVYSGNDSLKIHVDGEPLFTSGILNIKINHRSVRILY
jgi:YegS/Rv2252/BmrU family lipid kinase